LSDKRSRTIRNGVEELFKQEPFQRDVIFHLVDCWTSNLEKTERRITHAHLIMLAAFVVFLALDMKILSKVSFQGTEIERTGFLLCAVPIAIAYFFYRSATLVVFAHDIKTGIGHLYRKICELVYSEGLDFLGEVPSLRNLESYDTFKARPTFRYWHTWTTGAVTNFFALAPVYAIMYCVYRLWSYADVGIVIWIIMVVISSTLVVRGALYGWGGVEDDSYHVRRGAGSTKPETQAVPAPQDDPNVSASER
jgi:hypothetical protein